MKGAAQPEMSLHYKASILKRSGKTFVKNLTSWWGLLEFEGPPKWVLTVAQIHLEKSRWCERGMGFYSHMA